jgi:16S rRNA C1402 (ribose-2'-O) methylase RsmI
MSRIVYLELLVRLCITIQHVVEPVHWWSSIIFRFVAQGLKAEGTTGTGFLSDLSPTVARELIGLCETLRVHTSDHVLVAGC